MYVIIKHKIPFLTLNKSQNDIFLLENTNAINNVSALKSVKNIICKLNVNYAVLANAHTSLTNK